jgi:hypothetical protein
MKRFEARRATIDSPADVLNELPGKPWKPLDWTARDAIIRTNMLDSQRRWSIAWATSLVLLLVGFTLHPSPARAADADTSSPKATVKSFYTAAQRGDAAAMRDLIVVENDPDQQLAGAFAKLILSAKRLGDVAKQKYPGAATAFAQGTVSPEDIALIDSADVTLSGDNATVKLSGKTDDLKLKKVGNAWRMSYGEPESKDPARRTKQLSLLQSITEAMTQSADEIAADKFPTVQDAENAVKERLGAVMAKATQSDPPATKPTTKP